MCVFIVRTAFGGQRAALGVTPQDASQPETGSLADPEFAAQARHLLVTDSPALGL